MGETGRSISVELESNADGVSVCRISLAPDGGTGESDAGANFEGQPHLASAVSQLSEYLAGMRKTFDVALAPECGTPFQRTVWKACSEIPHGQTRSYWWTAVRAGNPYATRAVGSALGANPLPLFVPCHRVIRADGALGGFSADPNLKQLLLTHEAQELFAR